MINTTTIVVLEKKLNFMVIKILDGHAQAQPFG